MRNIEKIKKKNEKIKKIRAHVYTHVLYYMFVPPRVYTHARAHNLAFTSTAATTRILSFGKKYTSVHVRIKTRIRFHMYIVYDVFCAFSDNALR